MEIVDAGRFVPAADGSASYVEQLRVPALSVGTYSLPVGAVDDQVPHAEDEIYAVVSGRGLFTAGGRTVQVDAGMTLFVPAGEQHRFHDITEDMALLVFFAPAYSGRGLPGAPIDSPVDWAGRSPLHYATAEGRVADVRV